MLTSPFSEMFLNTTAAYPEYYFRNYENTGLDNCNWRHAGLPLRAGNVFLGTGNVLNHAIYCNVNKNTNWLPINYGPQRKIMFKNQIRKGAVIKPENVRLKLKNNIKWKCFIWWFRYTLNLEDEGTGRNQFRINPGSLRWSAHELIIFFSGGGVFFFLSLLMIII